MGARKDTATEEIDSLFMTQTSPVIYINVRQRSRSVRVLAETYASWIRMLEP